MKKVIAGTLALVMCCLWIGVRATGEKDIQTVNVNSQVEIEKLRRIYNLAKHGCSGIGPGTGPGIGHSIRDIKKRYGEIKFPNILPDLKVWLNFKGHVTLMELQGKYVPNVSMDRIKSLLHFSQTIVIGQDTVVSTILGEYRLAFVFPSNESNAVPKTISISWVYR